MAVVLSKVPSNPNSYPEMGYKYRVTGMATGVNACTIDDPSIDPTITPNGVQVLDAVGVAVPAQISYANYITGTLSLTNQTLAFSLILSSGADTEYVDVLVY